MNSVQGKEGKGGKGGKDSEEGEGVEVREPLPPVTPWKKILVSLAGATGNVILAIIISWIIFLSPKTKVASGENWVGNVATNSPAHAIGLRSGDRIVSVRDRKVTSWDGVLTECVIAAGGCSNVLIEVTRDGESDSLQFTLPLEMPTNRLEYAMFKGVEQSVPVIITSVDSNSPAWNAGFMSNDVVVAVDDVMVAGPQHVSALISSSGPNEIVLTVRRIDLDSEDSEPVELKIAVVPAANKDGRHIIGIYTAPVWLPYFPWMQYREPMKQLTHDAKSIFRFLEALTAGKDDAGAAAGGMAGPAVILGMTWMVAMSGFLNALGFIRMININLAIINLLPIPVLDGGHIMFSLYEMIFRRRVNPKVTNILVNIFAFLLIGFILYITFFRDIPLYWAKIKQSMNDRGSEQQATTNAPPEYLEGSNSVPETAVLGSDTGVVSRTQ